MTAMTRGPLPARVYWRRRALVVLLALGLVIGTARLLTLGSDASSEDPQASQVAADTTESAVPDDATTEASSPIAEPRVTTEPKRERKKQRPKRPVLAEPEGVCSDRDIAVTPSVEDAVGGRPVVFTLQLRTITSPACTWQVSPTTLTVKLRSGDDDIWSSQDCRRAVPTQEVVVRDNVSTEVEVTWSGRRSDDECSVFTDWALPGWYYVDAAALAGEPSDLHFQLSKPEPEVQVETVQPEPREDRRDRDRDRQRQSGQEQQGQDGDRAQDEGQGGRG
ncbi:hypothetical protein [Nocardioides euryhalodurans]|uniref:DUF4232 domain-containing protein n=1 Tax=Nocardioides euryhalodurans TaxID=2518370 RepID=A0A4V1BDW6_9ACTN|nr:hypothetical protein [Nocardioides euryhalodurans]QBR92552.1 hypothetical protein EXE57_09875 [Nocardioides euryhalodurans]